ncbi:MAG: hypothetical protein RRA94_00040 [Bacteroidota bacterium]|nr:hypothetical protein [Bacteroidota bacterium]
MQIPRWSHTYTVLRRGIFLSVLLILPCREALVSQPRLHAISVSAGLIEDSRIFVSPQSPDPVERQRTTNLGATTGYGASYRYRLYQSVTLQLHGEFVHTRSSSRDLAGTRMENGFDIWLLEVAGMFSLPFSSDRFEMYVGGGAGVYVGRRSYAVADAISETVSAVPAFGIHILVGAEYLLTRHLGIRADVVFRDPQMSVENRFRQSSVTANGIVYELGTAPFLSHVNLNGNIYSLGVSWHF